MDSEARENIERSEEYLDSSRIFIGNLATDKIKENELRQVFGQYGRILKVLVRHKFAFVQFDNPDSCAQAIRSENGRVIGGAKMGTDPLVIAWYCELT